MCVYTSKISSSTHRSIFVRDSLPAALMAEKIEPSEANNALLPDHAPLWRIKGGSAILHVDADG